MAKGIKWEPFLSLFFWMIDYMIVYYALINCYWGEIYAPRELILFLCLFFNENEAKIGRSFSTLGSIDESNLIDDFIYSDTRNDKW